MDPFSPVAPARIKVLLVPVVATGRQRLDHIADLLRRHVSIIPHASIAGPHDDAYLLAPQKDQPGFIAYDFTTSAPAELHRQLSPFELFREPLLVLGTLYKQQRPSGEAEAASRRWELLREELREKQPHAVHRRLLVFGGEEERDGVVNIPAGDSVEAGLRAAMCKVTVSFLRDLSMYAQALPPDVRTPGQTSRALQRPHPRPTSGYGTPSASQVSTPTNGNDGSRPGSRERPLSQPSSFDQSTGINRPLPNMLTRSDSRASERSASTARDSSRERKSQGFGTMSQSKIRERGLARAGIVLASIRMMVGQWKTALEELATHATKANSLLDHVWHAKALEHMLVCMLLMAHKDITFNVPLPCIPESRRRSVQMFNATTLYEDRRAASRTTLSNALPELTKMILDRYLMGEGSLEVMPLVPAEAAVRLAKLLAKRLRNGLELDRRLLADLVVSAPGEASARLKTSHVHGVDSASKGSVASILADYSFPNEDSISPADHIQLLGGAASVYTLLGMNRKRAMVLSDLVGKLTAALLQARKLGAAELGIHPAASVHADLRPSNNHGEGLEAMLAQLAAIYGIDIAAKSANDDHDTATNTVRQLQSFGWDALKSDVLRDLIALCEASANPTDVLKLATTFLRHVRDVSAEGLDASTPASTVSTDEQARVLAVAVRSNAFLKQYGEPHKLAAYWDELLLRDVEFEPATSEKAVIRRKALSRLGAASSFSQPSTNPLLYDPNAVRHSAGDQPVKTSVLVHGDTATCAVTLQNKLDVSTDVESLNFVTEGVQLETSQQPIKLNASCIQQVYVSVSPSASGKAKIIGCRIRMAGCTEQFFQIVNKPWVPQRQSKLKSLGVLDAVISEQPINEVAGPPTTTVSADVIQEQPCLIITSTGVFEDTIMLLEGESRHITLTIRNETSLPARIFKQASQVDLPGYEPDITEVCVDLERRQTIEMPVTLSSIAGASLQTLSLYYCSLSETESGEHIEGSWARTVAIPVRLTINAGLQVRKLEISDDVDELDAFMMTMHVHNAWPQSISFQLDTPGNILQHTSIKEVATPGETRTVFVRIPRWDSATTDDSVLCDELFDRLQLTWHIADDRHGRIDMSHTVLPDHAKAIIRGPPLIATIKLVQPDPSPPTKIPPSQFDLSQLQSFVRIEVQIRNRTNEESGPLFVRLQTSFAQAPLVTRDGASKERNRTPAATAGGAGEQFIDSIPPAETRSLTFVILPLTTDKIAVRASVRRLALAGIGSSRLDTAAFPAVVSSCNCVYLPP